MLKDFVVLYWNTENTLTEPLGFTCKAVSYDHAEEQLFSIYPDSRIAFIYHTSSIEIALDYYLNR